MTRLRGSLAMGLCLLLAGACASDTNRAATGVHGASDVSSDTFTNDAPRGDAMEPAADVVGDPPLDSGADVRDAATGTAAETVVETAVDASTIPDTTFGEEADAAPGLGPRVLAIGDLHADLDAARRAFRLAGVVDAGDQWIGGKDVVVQTGDLLDRWLQERELMDWMEARRADALAAGGDVVLLAGNHEDNNLEAYYPDVNAGACAAFADLPDDTSTVESDVAAPCRKRAAALLPGGSYARTTLAAMRVAAIVGDSVFVHGGLLPQYVASPASLDDMDSRWRAFARGQSGPYADQDIYDTLWERGFSDPDVEPDCDAVATVLARLGVQRMVVGHTRWDDINSACDGRVWRIDTSMSAYYGGDIEVLEISGTEVRPLVE